MVRLVQGDDGGTRAEIERIGDKYRVTRFISTADDGGDITTPSSRIARAPVTWPTLKAARDDADRWLQQCKEAGV